MKVQGISVGVAQTSRGYGKAGSAKSGPQIERPAHRRRERPDLIRGPPHRRRERADLICGHAYVRARALARSQQRIGNKRFIGVEDGVARDSERACQSAGGRKARSRGQLLLENRPAQLIVDLAVQRALGPRHDPQSRHGRVRGALQSGTLCGESGSLPTTIPGRTIANHGQASRATQGGNYVLRRKCNRLRIEHGQSRTLLFRDAGAKTRLSLRRSLGFDRSRNRTHHRSTRPLQKIRLGEKGPWPSGYS